MDTSKKVARPKREQSIPVKVSSVPRSSLPPVRREPAPVIQPVKKINLPDPRPTIKQLAQPVHDWPEERRRRLMWWLVGGGTAVIVIGWLALVRFEVGNGRNTPNLFAEASRLLRSVHWPGIQQPSKAEQEIRQLDQQVFPQFQQ